MIKGIAKLIVALNGNTKRTQIAAGFAWGVLFGLLPAGAVWALLFLISMFFSHNQGGKIFMTAVIKLASPLIYPFTDELGWFILHIEELKPVFTSLYNMPFVPWTRFNNTLVAGGAVAGIVLWLPSYFIMRALIPVYRAKILPKIAQSKIITTFKRMPVVQKIRAAIRKISDIKDAELF